MTIREWLPAVHGRQPPLKAKRSMTGLQKLNLVAAVAIGSFIAAGASASANILTETGQAAGQAARSAGQPDHAAIRGIVVDETGAPLSAAVVSAIGPMATLALTDLSGRFEVASLPPGRYLLQARMVGRTPSPQLTVAVAPQLGAQVRLTLAPAGSATPSHATAVVEYPVLAAGFAPSPIETAESDPPSNPRATAWRLRHLRRSVLKEAEGAVASIASGSDPVPVNTFLGPPSLDRRTSALPDFGDLSSLSGQINLLTVGSFDNPQQIFSADGFSHGVAYLSIQSSPTNRSAWTVRGAMTEGDFASWVLSSTYVAQIGDHHHYVVGMFYGTQRPDRSSALAVDSAAEGGRDIGILHGVDNWTLSRHVAIAYGFDYTRYDYAGGAGLVDPRAALTLTAGHGLIVRASAARQSVAPGSEELMLPSSDGIWLPPQHAVSMLADDGALPPERAQNYRVEVERKLGAGSDVRVGAFYQQVSNQLVTLFGLDDGAVRATPQYLVGDGGDVTARGYDVSLTHAITSQVHGSIDYTVSTADWTPGPGVLLLADVAPLALRRGTERLHDLTTSLETDIPQTATHVLMLYRINSGFAGRNDGGQPGIGYRFDVRVTQGLPFLKFAGTQWQALVGVRNFFRDSATTASSYDELLVVRPPKRIVGGLMLRF